jgi:lipopolysaccharide transport system ATP-binding protein
MDAIVIRNVTKHFRKSTISREYTTLKSELVKLLLRKRQKDRSHFIEVLKGIDLTIPRGKTVGIVGKNGSGKSTLLKLINGVYSPTGGSIEVDGRISALLELGAGFHPDFSGRENILINGIILGMSRAEIKARTPAIIDFAELGDFIDEPVRTYSSGMYMRLAFAVATHVDPDILVIDEILAVGDEHFAKKSLAKMNEFKTAGKTIVLVTHELGTVERWCDIAAWIDQGRIREVGHPPDVVAHYRKVFAEEEAARAAVRAHLPSLAPMPTQGPRAEPGRRWGSFAVELSEVRVTDAAFAPRSSASLEHGLGVRLAYLRTAEVAEARFHVALRTTGGAELWRGESDCLALKDTGEVGVALPTLPLASGEYRLEVGVRATDDAVFDCHRDLHTFRLEAPDGRAGGPLRLEHRWDLGSAAGAPADGRVALRTLTG